MGEALFWGLVAGSSLVIGGLLALAVGMRQRTLGVVMAFGAGVLISAVAYELVEEAFQTSATLRSVAFGLFAGCAAFAIGDLLLDRLGADSRKRSTGEQSEGSPLAIVLGIVLAGIPESAVIGLSLLQGEGVGVAVIVAVFLSNLPEAVAATTGLAASGWKPVRIMGLWAVVMAVTGLASLAGYALLDGASPTTLAFTLAFAGGAILTMLADTMMPEAFEHGGKLVGVATTVGFALAFAITALE
jgi:zinc transporter, ZIP family